MKGFINWYLEQNDNNLLLKYYLYKIKKLSNIDDLYSREINNKIESAKHLAYNSDFERSNEICFEIIKEISKFNIKSEVAPDFTFWSNFRESKGLKNKIITKKQQRIFGISDGVNFPLNNNHPKNYKVINIYNNNNT